jgi:hypothetical protein
VLLLAFASPVLGTNCYIVAPDGSDECVLVDPGIGIDEQIDKILDEYSLRPVAALVTHGHVDHTFSLAQLCRRRDLPVYIHEADVYRLDDPIGTLGPELAPSFAGFADDWSKPADIRPVRRSPGSSAGSTQSGWMTEPPSLGSSRLKNCYFSIADREARKFSGYPRFAGGEHPRIWRTVCARP